MLTSVSPAAGAVGTTVTITGTGLSGTTGLTLNGTAITGYTVNANGTSITFTIPTGATAGSVTVTTPVGTTTATNSFCVQYAPTASGVSRCGTGTVTLTASGAPTGGTYAFYTSSTGGTALSGASGASFTTPSLSATTTYYVGITTGSGANACEGPRTAVMATINPAAVANAGAAVAFCSGSSAQLGTAPVANQTYSWSPITGLSNPNIANPSVTLTNSGSAPITLTYTLTATTNTAGACQATSQATVTVNAKPTTPVATGNINNLTATSSSATGNQWYVNGVAVPGATNQMVQASIQGNYSVTVTSAAGCTSAMSNQVFLVVLSTTSAALAAQVQVYPNPTTGRFTLSLPTTHPAQVQVLNALGQVVQTRSATGATDLDLTGLASGIYAIRVQLGDEVAVKRIVLE